MYEGGYDYRAINCYRSAISGFHEKGLPVRQRPEVFTLLTGLFNLKPPQPRYSFTWDFQIVLEFIKNNWTDNKSLPIKNLTLLLALTSASRASSIHHLDIRFTSLSEEKFVFNFEKLLKTWKKSIAPPKLEIFAFEKDTNLCVIQTLKLYLNRLHESRDEKRIQLLLGMNKPRKSVSVSTVSRWIKNVMPLSGIDLSLFKGLSTCSVSTSRARLSRASILEILGESRWFSESTWQKFYKKPSVSVEKNFQGRILYNRNVSL